MNTHAGLVTYFKSALPWFIFILSLSAWSYPFYPSLPPCPVTFLLFCLVKTHLTPNWNNMFTSRFYGVLITRWVTGRVKFAMNAFAFFNLYDTLLMSQHADLVLSLRRKDMQRVMSRDKRCRRIWFQWLLKWRSFELRLVMQRTGHGLSCLQEIKVWSEWEADVYIFSVVSGDSATYVNRWECGIVLIINLAKC